MLLNSSNENIHFRKSLLILLPLSFSSLFRYPSQVFVGDTFNYLSGMTFAVVGILGHFSKTILLFFIPQVINFVYSVPQLFHFIPCPRHRLPKYDPETDLVSNSVTIFKESDLGVLGKIMFRILKMLRLVNVKNVKDGLIECNNLTLINFFIMFTGPIHERTLTNYLLIFQVLCSVFAFIIRYPLAIFFYGS
jgi:UDP-N-acetylglucosamine--dolichyl-phosphate N-acetylglucosaminephosphotransferase